VEIISLRNSVMDHRRLTVLSAERWEILSIVGTNKCSCIGEIHKAPNYRNASCKLTARHFCRCAKWMTGRLWVLM